MEIKSKFLYAKTRTAFEREKPNIPLGLDPLVFIEDTKEIWIKDTYFSAGYPSISVSEANSIITVTVGDDSFSLATTGDSLSIHKGDNNKIIISSNALNKVDTELPLEWDTVNKKLLHSKSTVVSGTYGQTTVLENTGIFVIPYITTNAYGHITEIGNKNVAIRDYVEQVAPSSTNADRNVILSYNEASVDSDTAQVRKANGLKYNDNTQKLTVGGGINTGGGINVNNGDLVVINGQIVGDLKGNVTGEATPKLHLSTKPEYGGASTELYGHVKVQDTFNGVPAPSSNNTDLTNAGVTFGVAASPLMVWNVKEELQEQINNSPNIGSIVIGQNAVQVTNHNQAITLKASNGITIGITESNEVEFKGIEIKAYDELGTEKIVSDNVKFGQDFVISTENEISLNWTNID